MKGEYATQDDERSPSKDDKNYPPLTDAEKNAAAKEWIVQKPLLTKSTETKETRIKYWDTIYMATKRFKFIKMFISGFLLWLGRCCLLSYHFYYLSYICNITVLVLWEDLTQTSRKSSGTSLLTVS